MGGGVFVIITCELYGFYIFGITFLQGVTNYVFSLKVLHGMHDVGVLHWFRYKVLQCGWLGKIWVLHFVQCVHMIYGQSLRQIINNM